MTGGAGGTIGTDGIDAVMPEPPPPDELDVFTMTAGQTPVINVESVPYPFPTSFVAKAEI